MRWAHPEIDYVFLRGAGFPPDNAHGREEMREAARANIDVWASVRVAADESRVLDSECVLVFDQWSGRGKRSELDMRQFARKSAHLFHVRDGLVTELVSYLDRDRALADLGLEG